MVIQIDNSKVAIVGEIGLYPKNYHPDQLYEEFNIPGLFAKVNPNNRVFKSIRELFLQLELDKDNINTVDWNPLADIIKPGNTVLLKPNLVLHKSKRKETTLTELITHPSIIIAIISYVVLALKDKGTIIIGDSPIQEANFEKIIDYLHLTNYINEFKAKTNIIFEIIDFRKEMSINKITREIQRIDLKGDPRGYTIIDLGKESALWDITYQYKKFRVTNYNKEKMLKFHNENHHSYVIANSVLQSDVIISLPKLKSHRKAGITCAMKNLVGINGSKDCLPHHRKGSIKENGDEYLNKSLRKKLLSNLEERRAKSKSRIFCFFLFLNKLVLYALERIFPYKDPYKEGSWYGNNTIPRTILDLNFIVNFVTKEGNISKNKQRSLFTVTDGIISGEFDGPLCPTGKETGLLIASNDFLANDIISSYLVGFDPLKIPTITFALNSKININNITLLEKIPIKSNLSYLETVLDIKNKGLFVHKPTTGWKNHIELESTQL